MVVLQRTQLAHVPRKAGPGADYYMMEGRLAGAAGDGPGAGIIGMMASRQAVREMSGGGSLSAAHMHTLDAGQIPLAVKRTGLKPGRRTAPPSAAHGGKASRAPTPMMVPPAGAGGPRLTSSASAAVLPTRRTSLRSAGRLHASASASEVNGRLHASASVEGINGRTHALAPGDGLVKSLRRTTSGAVLPGGGGAGHIGFFREPPAAAAALAGPDVRRVMRPSSSSGALTGGMSPYAHQARGGPSPGPRIGQGTIMGVPPAPPTPWITPGSPPAPLRWARLTAYPPHTPSPPKIK